MAQFSDMALTNAGRGLIAKTLRGKPLTFTRAVAGSGVLSDFETIPDPNEERERHLNFINAVSEMTGLIQPVRDMEIRGIETPPLIGTATIKTLLTNKDFDLGFFFNEIGLFAQDPDSGEEILYGYCSAGNKGDFMPGQGGSNAVKYYFDLVVVIGQAETVTAVFSDDPASVTVLELDDRIDAVLRYVKSQDDLLQYQIDRLAEKIIEKILDKAEEGEKNEL